MVRQVSLCLGLALALAPAAFAQQRGGPGPRGGDGVLEERIKKLEAELQELKAKKPAEAPAKPSAEEIAKARTQVEELGKAMHATAEKFHEAVKKLAEMEGKPLQAMGGGFTGGGAGIPGFGMMGGGFPGGPMMGGAFGGGMGGGRGPGQPERAPGGTRPLGDSPRPAQIDRTANPEIERMKKEMAEMKAILTEMRESLKRKQ